MSKRASVTLEFIAYESAAPTNDPADVTKLLKRLEEDPISELSRLQMMIDPSSSAESVPFDGTEADYCVIYVDQAVTLALNNQDIPITLNPTSPGVKTPVFYSRATITKLVLTNISAVVANVDMVLCSLP